MLKNLKRLNFTKHYKDNIILSQHLEALKKKYEEVNHLFNEYKTIFPPGHFYSPYADLDDIRQRESIVFNKNVKSIPDINLNVDTQLKYLHKLANHYDKLPFKAKRQKNLRYYFDNTAYSYTDAIVLFGMLHEHKPSKVIEIGSGHSSALMLDVNDLLFENKTELTFIEPYPKLLHSLVKPTDNFKLIDKNLSEVDVEAFKSLNKGDILFVDSTHVSKVGSDVNQIFFEIMPVLKPGVIIHIHDIFYPFEYPKEWIYEGRAWNEDYLLRAFLMNNEDYEILFFSNYMNIHHTEQMSTKLPLTQKNDGGSFWMKKN